MNEMDPIEEELCQAGVASPVSPLVVKLDKFRIMSDTDVPPEAISSRRESPRNWIVNILCSMSVPAHTRSGWIIS